jgi:hypothetical protein
LVRPVAPEASQKAESAAPVSALGNEEVTLAPLVQEDEVLVDYEASPKRNNMEINVVHLSLDYSVVPEEDLAHLEFEPRNAAF